MFFATLIIELQMHIYDMLVYQSFYSPLSFDTTVSALWQLYIRITYYTFELLYLYVEVMCSTAKSVTEYVTTRKTAQACIKKYY